MTIIAFPNLSPTQAQQLYNHLGTTRAVGELVGASHFAAYQWLKRLGVQTRKRGGNYGRTKEAMAAMPACNRILCREGRTDRWGNALLCAFTVLSECQQCRRGFALEIEQACQRHGSSLAEAREVGIESAASGERMPVSSGRKRGSV